MLKAKAVYTGLYAYSNEFVEALALEKWHTAILRMFSTEIEVEWTVKIWAHSFDSIENKT